MTPSTRARAVRYGVSLVLVAIVVAVRMAVSPAWSQQHPYLLFYPAIIAAGWYGGFGPGMVATVLAALSISYLWLPPLYTLRIASEQDSVGWLLFVAVGFAVSLLNEARVRAKSRATQHARALEQEAALRHKAEAEASRLAALTEELLRGEARYRTSFDADPAGRLKFARNGAIVEANRSAARLLGYRFHDQLVGTDPRRVFVDPADFDALMETIGRGVVVSNAPARWRRREGAIIEVVLAAREAHDGVVDVVALDVPHRDGT